MTYPCFPLSSRKVKKLDTTKFFRSQPIGRNLMTSIAQDVWSSLSIRGEGCTKFVTTQGLRATMISMQISAGFSDAAVLRTQHREINSVKVYHNFRETLVENQMRAGFRGSRVRNKAESDKVYKNTTKSQKSNVL